MHARLAVLLAALASVPLAGCLGDGGGGGPPPPPPAAGVAAAPAVAEAPPAEAAPAWPHFPSDGAAEVAVLAVPSRAADGHQVPITVYRPKVASAEQRVPVLLHSHGFAGSRATAPDAFQAQVAAGFGVVSIDMRGHGEARGTSEIRVHHMDYEIQDVLGVIDHVATLPWVLLDAPGDPRLGAIGGSYGGGYQLLAAALDDRLDSLAPEITWSSLPQSLAPNGVPKSAWIDLLFVGGTRSGTFAPEIQEALLWVELTNSIPDGSEPGEPDVLTPFTASSPASYPAAIDVPTFLYQGVPDTLFNLNQAVANYLQVKATGAPVQLHAHLNGHILSTEGTLPDPPVPPPEPIGLQPGAGPSPCGDAERLAILWHQRHLLGLAVDTGPEVCLALDDGSLVEGASFPLPGTAGQAIAVGSALVVPQSLDAGAVARATLLTAERETVVAGIPRLSGQVTSPGPDAIVFWTLQVVGADGATRVVDAQVTPHRPTGSGAFELDLMGVAVRLQPGESLLLAASGFDPQYAHNSGRLPGAVVVENVQVTLPVLAGPQLAV